jgi:hypothetical protein
VLAVFPAVEAASDDELLASAVGRPDLVVETMNVLITAGHWAVIGNAPIVEDVPIPVFVVPVGLDRIYYIQNINGELVRPAIGDEIETLRTPKSFSPALVDGS